MAKLSGKNAKVMYGSVTVAEQVEWSMSGFTMETVRKDPAFGDTIASYVSLDIGDPGTISFRGNYDAADTSGQRALETACEAATGLTDLYLYANTSTFWRVGTGGEIIVTKCNSITMPRNGIGTISFEGQVTDAAMEQVGTGS
jgi:hypothetical protein